MLYEPYGLIDFLGKAITLIPLYLLLKSQHLQHLCNIQHTIVIYEVSSFSFGTLWKTWTLCNVQIGSRLMPWNFGKFGSLLLTKQINSSSSILFSRLLILFAKMRKAYTHLQQNFFHLSNNNDKLPKSFHLKKFQFKSFVFSYHFHYR